MTARKKPRRRAIASKKTYLGLLTGVVLVALAFLLAHWLTPWQTGTGGVDIRRLNLRTTASMYCLPNELESLSIKCDVSVDVLNMENETIVVYGIVVLYDGLSRRVDMPVNVSVEPNSTRTVKGEFDLPKQVDFFDIRIYIRVIYLDKYLSVPVEEIKIAS